MDDDEITRLLNDTDDEDNTITFIPEAESTPANGMAASNDSHHNNELEELKRQLAEQQAEIQKLRLVPSTHQSVHAPTPLHQETQHVPSSNREVLKTQLQNAYLADPAEAMLNLYEMAKREAVEEARKSIVPVAGQTTRFAIDQFKNSARFLSDEAEEFDHLVSQISPQAMAQADPSSLAQQLQILKHAAKGAALEKRQANPQPRVPVYSAGMTLPSASQKPVQVKLSKAQKEFYQIGLDNGLKPTEIMQLIKEEGIQ